MILRVITPGDLAKDCGLAALGFSPAAVLAHFDTALTLGLLNLLVVVIFRAVELRLKYRRERGGKKQGSEAE